MFKKLFGKGKSGGKSAGGADEPMPTWETAAAAPPEQLAGGAGESASGGIGEPEGAGGVSGAGSAVDAKLAISLFGRFDDPSRFERVAGLGRALTADPRKTEEGVAGLGHADDSLVQIVLDGSVWAESGRSVEGTARGWLEELRAAVGSDLSPGEYAGVSYFDDSGAAVQLTWTILSGSSRAKPRVFENRERVSSAGG